MAFNLDQIEDTEQVPELRLWLRVIQLAIRDYVKAFGRWDSVPQKVFRVTVTSRSVLFPRTPHYEDNLTVLCRILNVDVYRFKRGLNETVMVKLNRMSKIDLKDFGIYS